MPPKKPTRRHFTAAAQAAAIEAGRRKREAAAPRNTLEVFVVRLPGAHLQFAWEIRRFEALVLDRSVMDCPTVLSVRFAGDAALSDRICGA